jgi:hypothetical protein
MIPARAWDTEGVTSLRALHAPFLVTSDELVAEIVDGELADELLAGLEDVGVTGLALLPEGLRHLSISELASQSSGSESAVDACVSQGVPHVTAVVARGDQSVLDGVYRFEVTET